MNARLASSTTAIEAAPAYDADIYAWALAQAGVLRARRFEAADLDNIAEEIESLGNEQAHAIESHLVVLVEHLLKLSISDDVGPRRGWRMSVIDARDEIDCRLARSSSLRRQLPGFFNRNWPKARRRAQAGLREAEEHRVPADPPFTVDEALDPDFFAGA